MDICVDCTDTRFIGVSHGRHLINRVAWPLQLSRLGICGYRRIVSPSVVVFREAWRSVADGFSGLVRHR
jgi:hypothetical protein